MIAIWRMSERIPSFDVFMWMAMAKADGATKVIFDTRNPRISKKGTVLGLDNVTERFRSIIEPAPVLLGLKSRHINSGDAAHGLNPSAQFFGPWVESGRQFDRIQSIKPPVDCKYTVTIRDNETGTARGRDSNRAAWEAFAAEIGAVVIDDYCRQPIHLHDRLALYAGARMNFGVCNGPVHMITMSPYPVSLWVNSNAAVKSHLRWGLEHGRKMPHMLDNQHMVWAEDNLDNLRRTFDAMRL